MPLAPFSPGTTNADRIIILIEKISGELLHSLLAFITSYVTMQMLPACDTSAGFSRKLFF